MTKKQDFLYSIYVLYPAKFDGLRKEYFLIKDINPYYACIRYCKIKFIDFW